ncbi:hypothetical protein [Dyadobacter psychrotolerans]|uniref:Uncharacterized protein n=1 Tax=Dyadobacter psychrotolerans TaxID=2541721 RepID=A0A4R5DW28_9BACT|nr:hypothetical protein [Dyadobacter psychrotolerans]TDE18077.1 hypothetical protein E0F88_00560 [Dyadobacter psychrotolerans]
MNEKNFEYLKDQVKFTGFGQDLEADLKANLAKAQTEFRLQHNVQYGKDEMSSSLHFKKSSQSDMYFFNSYTASLKKDNQAQPLQQTFYINKEGGNITQKEAFNMLDGRAVNKDLVSKEGKLYNAWVQLDFKETAQNGNYKFKQFSDNYGFDLEKSLAKLPIKELSEQTDKTRLLESLQKGNRQAVTLSHNGNEQKVFIEANPQFKAIVVYDQNQKRIRPQQMPEEAQKTGQQQTQKTDDKKPSISQPESKPEGSPSGGKSKKSKMSM